VKRKLRKEGHEGKEGENYKEEESCSKKVKV